MSIIKKKILSKIYYGYGLKYYPKQFQVNFRIYKKFKVKKKNSINQNKISKKLNLASVDLQTNPLNIWNKRKFRDREDLSSLHRWTWALKMISKKKNSLSIKEKRFIEDSIFNWCVKYSNHKIDKNNLIFEPYNISERITNYLILIKLNILKPNDLILHTLEKQFNYLIKNIEIYKFKISNHALNNLKSIYLFSVYSNNEHMKKYSLKFIIYLLKKFLDKNHFFKFGSSNYQFIFTKWISDILFYSKNSKEKEIKYIENIFKKILCNLNFFKQIDKNNIKSIPIFGNVSPDYDHDWLINFFYDKKKNLLSKKYWENLSYSLPKKKILSKEWIKIQNKKFSIYCRNPKLIGFDFNHSHNDFFNFELFYKGRKIVLDPGRENYSQKSLFRDVSGKFHNSIRINDKAIYDDFLFYKPLTKIGIKKIQDCRYSVQTNYKNFVKLRSLEKGHRIIREIKLHDNIVMINDRINIVKKSNIKLRFNLNMTKKELKRNKGFKILFFSNSNDKKYIDYRNFYKGYGQSYKGLSLIYEYKDLDKLNSSFQIKG